MAVRPLIRTFDRNFSVTPHESVLVHLPENLMPIYRGHMDSEQPISTEVNGGCGEGCKPKSPHVAPEEILLDAVDVSIRLKVSEDWVWDHSSRRAPFLPAIWLSDGVLRFKPSKITEFIDERERLSTKRRRRR